MRSFKASNGVKNSKIKIYAKALAEAISEDKVQHKEIIDNFLKIIVKTGQEKNAQEILKLADDILLARRGKRKITFETAREMTKSQRKSLDGFVKNGDVVKEKINPELIAGVKITINDLEQFDASMQSKLSKLFYV